MSSGEGENVTEANSAAAPANEGPLKGLRVIEMGTLIAGPFCGQILGDFGADVIKIEDPKVGDPMRQWGRSLPKGLSPWWPVIGRNKKSVGLNLRTPEGRAIAETLIDGADVLIDPVTEAALGAGFDRAIAALRYGGIAINAWTALNFLTPTLTWGGFPSATPADVQSGIGVVHNALLLDRVERSVTRGPFRPFPRSVGTVIRSLSLSKGSALPKPPWFVTSRTGDAVSEGLTRFRVDGGRTRLAATLAKAFRA